MGNIMGNGMGNVMAAPGGMAAHWGRTSLGAPCMNSCDRLGTARQGVYLAHRVRETTSAVLLVNLGILTLDAFSFNSDILRSLLDPRTHLDS